jgi:hypothetical protein
MSTTQPVLSPECRDPFKHDACGRQALDPDTDEIVACQCPHHAPAGPLDRGLFEYNYPGMGDWPTAIADAAYAHYRGSA